MAIYYIIISMTFFLDFSCFLTIPLGAQKASKILMQQIQDTKQPKFLMQSEFSNGFKWILTMLNPFISVRTDL